MAAWIVVGVVGGVWLGFFVGIASERKRQGTLDELRALIPVEPGDKAMLDRVLDRLLEAVVPKYSDGSVPVPEEYQQMPGEYEEPDDARPVMDWTDPFIGLERPVVARLAPGEQIPGFDVDDERPVDPVEAWREMGEGTFEEWVRETAVPDGDGMSWVEPVDLEGEHGG